MRSSRRAAIADGFKVWEKYEYNYVFTKDLVGYKVEEKIEGGWYGVNQINGYAECDIVLKKGKYYDSYAYSLSDQESYWAGDYPDRKVLWQRWWRDSSVDTVAEAHTLINIEYNPEEGDFQAYETCKIHTIVNQYENERYEWWVEDYVGIVRANEGKYPDAGRGYTFVKTDGEYTIMTDGEKNYAYKLRG